MTLKRKLLVSNLLLVLGLVVIGAASFWRLTGLTREVQVPRFAYTELRTAEVVATQIAMAKGLLSAGHAGLDDFINFKDAYGDDEQARQAYAPMMKIAETAKGRLRFVLDKVSAPSGSEAAPASGPDIAAGADRDRLVSTLDDALWDLD